MAESLGTVGVVWAQLALDSSQYEAGMARARTTAQTVASSLTATVGRLTGIGVGLYAVKRGIDAVVKSFVEFDTQMHYIWTLTDKTEAEMASLSNELRSLARQYNATSAEAARAMYQIYSAVFYGSDAMKILQASLKGAAAGLSDVLTAVDVTTTVLNAYRMSADKATYVNDVLFQTVKYGKTVYSELANQFGRLAGVSAPAGASLEDMAAAIATLTRQGIATDWAITSLRQTIMQILRPGEELRKIIEGLGYEGGRALIADNGFAKSLGMINDAAEKSGVFLENLFSNVRAVTAVMPLASTAAGEYAKDQARIAQSAGEMGRAFDKVKVSWEYMLKVVTTSIKDSAISIGKVFLPAIKAVLDVLNPLLRGFAYLMEALEKIGGGYALGAIAVFGTMYAAVSLLHLGYTKMMGGITKATIALQAWAGVATKATAAAGMLATSVAGLNAQWYTSSTAAGVAAAAPGAAGGMAAMLAKLSPLKLLGAGAAAAIGGGAMLKGLVNLDLALSGKVTGAEKVRAEIEGSLETALGPIIGGAVIGSMFAPGIGTAVGAGIGALVAGAGALVIWVKHTVEKAAAGYGDLKTEALKIAGSISLPASVGPSRTGKFPEFDALVNQIVSMSDALQAAGQEGMNAAESVVQSLYDVERTGWGEFKRVLNEDFAQIQAVARAVGIELSREDIDQLIQKWRESIREDIPDGLSGISAYIKDQLPENIKDALDDLDASMKGKLDSEGFTTFMESFTGQIQEFVSAVTGGISNRDIQASVDLWKDYFASLAGMGSTEELARAQNRIRNWFSLITEGLSDEEMASFAIRLAEAGMSFEGLSEIMALLGVDTAALRQVLFGLWEETKAAATDAIPTTSAQIQAARADFMKLYDELKAEDITLDTASTKFKDLKDMASLWADYAKMAEKAGWDSADSIKFLADEMDDLVGDAEDAASAVDMFTKALQNVALAAGASTQIQGIFADMQKLLIGASTLGEAADIMAALQSGQGTAESFKESLEQIFAPDSTYAQESKEWARKTWSQIGDQFPKLGSTIADLTDQAKKLAEEQKKAAEETARCAKKAAEDAYRADQEAFRNQFIRPTLDAVATGDFAGAAEKINALRDNFADLVNQGAQLGMSATDVLGMMQSARGELLSAIEGLIAINSEYPELVEALQYARDEISKMWEEPKTALEQALSKFKLEDLVKDPAGVATGLRELAKKDAKEVHTYTSELITSLQDEITARAALGYDTELLDDALLKFKASLTGSLSPLQRFMDAIDKYSNGIMELVEAIFPGMGDIFGKVVAVGKAIATTGGLAWKKGKPVAMAEGGIATEPTFAMIGEAGPEVVLPISSLANLSGFSPFSAEMPSVFTMPAMSNQPTFDVGQTFGGLDTGAIDSLSSQIQALGSRIVSAASGLVSAIESSTLMLMSTFASVPAISALPGAPEPEAFESNVQVNKGFAYVPSTALPGAPEGFGETLELESRFTSDMLSAMERLERTVAQISALPAVQPSGALTPIPEIPTFDATPEGIEAFIPDIVEQAVAGALSALNITPRKPAESVKEGIAPFIDPLMNASGIFNSVVSLVVALGKQVVAAWNDLKDSAKEAAEAIGERLVKAAEALFSAVTSLASNMQSLITSTETYTRLQSALAAFQGKIFDSLMGWAWPLIAIFEKLTGAIDETIDSYNSLNVPTGYKVTRAEWAAARPGEPGEKRAGTGSELPEWVSDLLEQFKEAIQAVVDVFKSFFDIMSGVWEALGPILMEGILPALLEFGNTLVGIGEKIRDELLPILQEHLAGTITGFLEFFFGAISGAITFFVDTIGAIMPNLELFAQSMGDLGATLPGLAAALSDALSPAINTLLEGLTLLAGWLTTTMIPGLQALLTGFGVFWETSIAPFFTEKVFPQILEWANRVYDFMSSNVIPFLENTLWPFMENEIWPMFTGIVDDLIDTLGDLWSSIEKHWPAIEELLKTKIADWVDGWMGKLDLLEAYIEAQAGDALAALHTIWTSESLSLWQKISSSFGIVFGDIVAAASRLWEAMAPVVEPLLQLLGGALFLAIETVATALDALGLVIRILLAPFKGLANVIIFIHNLFSSKKNDWNYLELAEGGVVTKPTLALVGEAGPEAIIPLSGGPVIPGISGRAMSLSGGAMIGGNAGSSDGTILVQTKVVNQMNGRTISAELYNTRRHLSKLGSSNGRAWNPA